MDMVPGPLARSDSAEPLARYGAFASGDLASFRRYLSQSYCDHHVRQRSHHDPLSARHNRLPLSAMSLNYLAYGAEVEMDIDPFERFYMVELPQSGAVTLELGSQRLVNRPGFAAVISPTMPVRSAWSADCAQLMLKISRSALEQHLSGLIGRALGQPLVFDPAIDLSSAGGATLERFAGFMVDHFGSGDPLLVQPAASQDLEHAFMSALLMAQPNSYSEVLRKRSNSVAPRHVRRAVEFIGNNLREDIGIEALVAVSGVSARALYAGFEKFVGMPPQALIKNMRLDRAREDLIAADASGSVAAIALRWQFSHFGRFSIEYRKRFGERPMDTLRR